MDAPRIILRIMGRNLCRKSAKLSSADGQPGNDNAPGRPGALRGKAGKNNDQPRTRVRPNRVRIGLIGWNQVIGLATPQLLLLPAGSWPPEVTPWA